jgi:hypothetical protein
MRHKPIPITLSISDAEVVRDNLADLLCWWQGFKAGMKASGNEDHYIAENGIEAARDLRLKIGDEISKYLKNQQSTI